MTQPGGSRAGREAAEPGGRRQSRGGAGLTQPVPLRPPRLPFAAAKWSPAVPASGEGFGLQARPSRSLWRQLWGLVHRGASLGGWEANWGSLYAPRGLIIFPIR